MGGSSSAAAPSSTGLQAQSQQPTFLQQMGVTPQQGQFSGQPQYSSQQQQYSSVSPSSTAQAGFIPPPQGYGVPTTTLQQVPNTYPPSQLSGSTPQTQLSTQLAGYSPMNTQPNYNQQFGGTTGYKSTMK